MYTKQVSQSRKSQIALNFKFQLNFLGLWIFCGASSHDGPNFLVQVYKRPLLYIYGNWNYTGYSKKCVLITQS